MRKTAYLALCSLVTIAAAACSESTAEGDGPLTGSWTFSATATSTEIEGTCSAEGTIDLAHDGSTLGGESDASSTCTGPDGTISEDLDGPIEGSVNGTAVVIDADACVYTGIVEDDDTMSGTVACVVEIDDVAYPFTGTWTASR